MQRHHLIFLVAIAALTLTPGASLSEGFELNQFHPSGSLTTDYLTVHSGHSDLPNVFEVGALFDYSNNGLVGEALNGDETALVGHQVKAHLLGVVSGWGFLRLTIDVPIYMLQTGDEGAQFNGRDAPGGGGIGDIRLTPKGTLFETDARREGTGGGIALALYTALAMPTGDVDALQGGGFEAIPASRLTGRAGRAGAPV